MILSLLEISCKMHLPPDTIYVYRLISIQLMDPNCKPVHPHAYIVPRSVDHQLKQSKEIVKLLDIGILE
jgi:hypothetical protein